MKKLLFFVVAAATLLSGCKKDDSPASPVTGTVLPTSSAENPVAAGSAVTIQGKGFTQSSEIWLRALTKAAETDVQATVTAVTDASITFTAPVVSGDQAVILKQEGGEWNLGKMYFAPSADILPRKLIRLVMTDDEETSTRNFTYDEQGRLAAMKADNYGSESVSIEYGTDAITMRETEGSVYVFRLENGCAVSCKETEEELDTRYSYGNGYLSGFENELYKGTLSFGEDGCLKTYQVTSEDEDAYGPYIIEYVPNTEVRNNLNLDLLGDDMFSEMPDEVEVRYAQLLGIAGTRSAYLPAKLTVKDLDGNENYALTYEYVLDGEYIAEIRIRSTNEWDGTLKLYYEE